MTGSGPTCGPEAILSSRRFQTSVEANQDARFDDDVRLDFAYALAESTIEYLRHHYDIDITD